MRKFIKSDTRKGAASFYAVIFAALVFTVIVVSFIRLMISESSQNTDSDLSQSAYDAALMGVEDAKAAITKCINSPNRTACEQALYQDDCNAVSQSLYSQAAGSVSSGSVIASADQGYTCVKLSRDLPDYKIRFTEETYTAVIPIDNAAAVRVSWLYKGELEGNVSDKYTSSLNTDKFYSASEWLVAPPVLSVGVIETGNNDIGTVILRPSSTSGSANNANNAYIAARSKNINKPAVTRCSTNQDYACKADIKARISSIEYLVISLPYKESNISIKVEQFSDSNMTAYKNFNSQVSVDSTGRTNDYYRRVESRLLLSDFSYPYPEYALSAYGEDGDDNGSLNKNFRVTNNCWVATDGDTEYCTNESGSRINARYIGSSIADG